MRNLILITLILAILCLVPGYSKPLSTKVYFGVYQNWGEGKRKFFSSKERAKVEIREVYDKEMKEYLRNLYDYPEFTKAILSFDVKKASEILKKTLPLTSDNIKSGDSQIMLNAFSALIATNYLLTDNDVFNAKKLWLLGYGYDFENEGRCNRPYNIFSNAKLINTAELLAYWQWLNYDPFNGELKSTMFDYDPFSERELSLLYWSHILFNWMKLEYKSQIATELVKLEIVELVDGEYKPTEKWTKKLAEDNDIDEYDNVESKVAQKYGFELKPWVCTLYILDRINNKPFELYDTVHGGGGPGGGGGHIPGHGHWRAPKRYPIDEKLIPQYQKEELLELEKIKELLRSETKEEKFRGVVHLFRHINQTNDYALLNLIIPAINNYNRQRYSYIVEQLNSLSAKADKNSDTKNTEILRNFLVSLITNDAVDYPTIFFKVIVMTKDRDFTEELINLMLEYKIESYATQEAILDYIVDTNRKDLIPRLFEWALSTKSDDHHLVSCFTLIDRLVKLDRDMTLTYSNKVMLKNENVSKKKLNSLGYAFFSEVTGDYFGENLRFDKSDEYGVDEYSIDPKKLDDNEVYFKNAYLYNDAITKRAFYQAVAQNCSRKVDNTVFNWFRNETNPVLKMEILKCLTSNIFKRKVTYYYRNKYDEEAVDKKTLRVEILENRDRFKKLADIALNENSIEFDKYIRQYAKYLKPDDAWNIYEKLIERYKFKKGVCQFIYEVIYSDADDLNLIDVNELTWNTYQYLIKNLASEESNDLIPEFFTTALEILSTRN